MVGSATATAVAVAMAVATATIHGYEPRQWPCSTEMAYIGQGDHHDGGGRRRDYSQQQPQLQ